MKKKQFETGLTGLFIGLLIGAAVGFFSLNQTKKSQRSMALPYAIGIFGIGGGLIGYRIGSNIGKTDYINERLGIKQIQEGYDKDGRYCYGFSKWTDKRDGTELTLITGRSTTGELASALNGKLIMNHQIRNANQQTVPKHHELAKQYVFGKLKEKFSEEPIRDIETFFY